MADWLHSLAQQHIVLAAVFYIVFRASAVVMSPIPGVLLDVPAIALFGWPTALLLAECGVMGGAMTAFGVARVFRERMVGRFVALQKVNAWERSLPKRDQFLAWVALRLPSNIAFDYISYAAGLTECSVGTFFWSTLIGNLPLMTGFFLMAGVGLNINTWLGWLLPLLFLIVATILSTRYLARKTSHQSTGRG